jgi:hypothetical protein
MTVDIPSTGTDTFQRIVTITGCELTTSDADGSAITTNVFGVHSSIPQGTPTNVTPTRPVTRTYSMVKVGKERSLRLTLRSVGHVYMRWCRPRPDGRRIVDF